MRPMRCFIWIIALGLCIGCRAPMPSFKPYSNTRIPPPQTGSFGDPYYNTTPAQPQSMGSASGQTVRASDTLLASHQDDPSSAEADDELDWTAPQRGSSSSSPSSSSPLYQATIRRSSQGRVDRADYDQSYDSTPTIQRLSYEEDEGGYSPGTTAAGRRIDLRGMPVNDATAVDTDSEIIVPSGAASSSWKAR